MRRRALLAAIAGGLATAAGCVQSDPAGPDPTTPEPTDASTETLTDSPTDAPAETPTVDDSDPFDGIACSTLDDNADRHVCAHATDPGETNLALVASPEVFDPGADDAGALTFTLSNDSTWPISFNPYAWSIHRRDDGDWTRVAPDMHPEPMTELAPDGEMRWVLPSGARSTPEGDARPLSVVLDPGTYAFTLTVNYGGFSTETAAEDPPEERVALVALFRLESALDPDAEATETGA